MTFFEHLDELRKRLIITVIAYVIGVLVSYPLLYEFLLKLMLAPIDIEKLIYVSPFEPFLVRLKISLFAAFVITLPVTLYNVLAFLAPALTKKEKRSLYLVVFVLIILFASGVTLGYYKILPVGIAWLMGQGGTQLESMLKATEYISVVSWSLLSFGVAFETPVLLYALVKLGIISKEKLQKSWKLVYVIILITSGILTPDHSPLTMLLLAIPMILLYHSTILALRWHK